MNMIVPRKVWVYRNLHKGCWSVKDRTTGRIIAHRDEIFIEGHPESPCGCAFKVSQKGRERVLKEKVKNVHAGVWGYWMQGKDNDPLEKPIQVFYNPYKWSSFVDSIGSPVMRASRVELRYDGTVWAENASCDYQASTVLIPLQAKV